MTDPQVGILMMAMFIVTIFLGFPIAFTYPHAWLNNQRRVVARDRVHIDSH